MSISRLKEVLQGDNKPPLSNSSEIILPFSQYQAAASSCHPMEGKEDQCQSCTSSAIFQWAFVDAAILPPRTTPGSPFRSVTWHSHSAPISQCSPVICTSLTCAHSDVHWGMAVLLHYFQRKWSAGLGGQSVASWIRYSYFLGGSAEPCQCVCVGWKLAESATKCYQPPTHLGCQLPWERVWYHTCSTPLVQPASHVTRWKMTKIMNDWLSPQVKQLHAAGNWLLV